MTYIKLLTALAGLALLTACGATAKGDPAQTTDCAANPFGASCIAEDINVEARITDCITAGNAGDTKCASLTSDTAINAAINTCLTNPFDESCTASDFTFSTYAEMARVNRVSFCGMTGNAGNALCTALTTCQANPFGATCGAYFESAKNPYCETNPTEDPCVNTADWLARFTANGGTALPTTPNTTTRVNQFLQGTPTGFASGANAGIRQNFGNPTTDIAIQTLTFAEAVTATGGVAFFGGAAYSGVAGSETSTGNNFYYAGILAGTNLGAPITETITSARWTGQIRADSDDSTAKLTASKNTDFGLDITFDGAKGTIKENLSLGALGTAYEIDGMFDENGIITGSVDYGLTTGTGDSRVVNTTHSSYSPGTLSGIIGQNGAVGAFHSGRVGVTAGFSAQSFAGGFVVTPPPPPDPCVKAETCVNTADWLGSFTGNDALPTTPNTTPTNEFLAISAKTASSLTAVVPTTLFMTGSTTNGAAFFTENSRFYAGVLAGTNLGAPITETITNARWTGQIRADSSDSAGVLTANPTDGFGLDITFGGTGTGGTMKTIAIVPIRNTVYEIDGMFDANGIITGTVDFGGSVSAGNRVVDTSHPSYSPGTLSGIIGQNGAVGVFHSDNANPEAGLVAALFSGGFFVTPPAN